MPDTDCSTRAGDHVLIPWELDDVRGTVLAVDEQLGRAWVEVQMLGRPEPFSLPLDALTRIDEPRELARGDFDPGLDSHQILTPLLDTIGADRPVRVGMLLTRDEDANRVLEIDITLLAASDQDLPAPQVLELHDRIREALYEVTGYEFVIVVRIGWREAHVA